MGTNYYLIPDNPETVESTAWDDVYEDTAPRIHLGKRSAGWNFYFRIPVEGIDTLESLSGWLETTPGRIETESGSRLNVVEWFRMAANWGHDNHPEHPTHLAFNCWCAGTADHRLYHGQPMLSDTDRYNAATTTQTSDGRTIQFLGHVFC